MKALIAIVCSSLVLGFTAVSTAEEFKIGYIITQRLLIETKAGQQAAEELKQRLGEARKELDAKLAEIKELEEDIQRRMMMLSEDEKKKVAEEHERQLREARRMKEDVQRSLKKTEAEVMERVNTHLRGVIEKYGSDNGYDIILDASTLVYVSETADITDAVIKAADAGN